MSGDSTAVVHHSVVTEVTQALRRLARVRLDWSGAHAAAHAQAAAEDPVGFVFAGALPPRALLLEVNHVGFLWCAAPFARSAPNAVCSAHPWRRLTRRCARCARAG